MYREGLRLLAVLAADGEYSTALQVSVQQAVVSARLAGGVQ